MATFDKNSALLIIDMLNDFICEGRPLEVPAARGIVSAIQKAREKAYQAGAKVVYSCDNHIPNDPEFQAWPPHAVIGTEGAQVIEDLAPKEGDSVVPKHTILPFHDTGLDTRLRELGVKKLFITGVLTDICVYHAAASAAVRGYDTTILTDCVAALTPEDHEYALRQAVRIFKVKLESIS